MLIKQTMHDCTCTCCSVLEKMRAHLLPNFMKIENLEKEKDSKFVRRTVASLSAIHSLVHLIAGASDEAAEAGGLA